MMKISDLREVLNRVPSDLDDAEVVVQLPSNPSKGLYGIDQWDITFGKVDSALTLHVFMGERE